jgi:probable rRNA maturation factor
MKIAIFGISNKALQRKYRIFAGNVLKKANKKVSPTAKTINIIIVNDDYIRKLNKQFLKRDRPTDVLSFPMNPAPIFKNILSISSSTSKNFANRKNRGGVNDVLLGEIYISKDRVKIQAREQKINQNEEVCNLIEHGILHLLGLSHHKMYRFKD